METINLNALRDRAYKTACEHGFHDEELSNEHCLCLVISELMEAVEADRKGNYCHSKISSTERYTAFPTEESRFKKEFVAFVKDTVEDELSDAVIRLLDLYGLRGIELDTDAFDDETIGEYAVTYQRKSFTESIMHITISISSNIDVIGRSCMVPDILLLDIFGLAKHLNIDLLWHIEQKMRYNELRPMLNGKRY